MATKKIKKVETPIDQRETFVSLQKNFADSEISVEEKLKTLYALQEADSAIDKIMQMRGELPSEVEALENEIADLKARQTQDVAVIEAYNQTIAENRQNIVDCDTQIEKYQQQLMTSPTAVSTILSTKRLRIRDFFARSLKRTSMTPRRPSLRRRMTSNP